MSGAELAIDIRGLVKRYRVRQGWRGLLAPPVEKLALDHIDLQIAPGEIFGLLGPNGAGKTTLVRVLSTLLLPTAGQVRVAGLDVVRQSREVRRRIGVVYGDERTFFWRLSVLENLRFYAALYGLPANQAERRIWELLDLVNLRGDAHTRMHHFSTGMKQRAAIARGLLSDPQIIVLDEPTRTLDPIAARSLRGLVRGMVADGQRTVLLATNTMTEAEEMCGRLAFLNHGRILLYGTLEDLRGTLQQDDVHVLVVGHLSAPGADRLTGLPGVRSVAAVDLDDGTTRLEVRTARAAAAVPAVIRSLVESGTDVWSCTQRELTLEEIFGIAVTGAARKPVDGSPGLAPRLVGSELP